MRAAIYARVSTERQERQQTIGSQVSALRDWVRIPTDASRAFRRKAAGDSEGSQPLIPRHSSHP
jgi:DNA invertase Pin-like site-specific DNA recombinase